jgi:glycosyltransferase involved in cell wall biosynthesis
VRAVNAPKLPAAVQAWNAFYGAGTHARNERREPELSVGLAWDEAAAAALCSRPFGMRGCGVLRLLDEPADSRGKLLRHLRWRSLRSMDLVWCLTRAQAQVLQPQLDPPVEHLVFGVDTSFYAPAPYPVAPLVFGCGSGNGSDLHTLYAALELVHAARPDAELVVHTAAQLPVPPGVTRLEHAGHATRRRLYARAALTAVASRPGLHASGLGAALESMATGRPVVATGLPGMDEYVQPGRTGLLVPPKDPAAMADGILTLLEDPPLAAQWGGNARRSVVAGFSSAAMAEQLAKLLVKHAARTLAA